MVDKRRCWAMGMRDTEARSNGRRADFDAIETLAKDGESVGIPRQLPGENQTFKDEVKSSASSPKAGEDHVVMI